MIAAILCPAVCISVSDVLNLNEAVQSMANISDIILAWEQTTEAVLFTIRKYFF